MFIVGHSLALLAAGDDHWLEALIRSVNAISAEGTFLAQDFNIRALIALVLVSLSCGAVGSLVVGSRMAFFSDALAHCAFAGVSIGFVFFTLLPRELRDVQQFWGWVTPIMVAFGILVGYGITYVRSRTGLTSDTVIGVFFAGAIGLAAMLRKLMHSRALFGLEDFLFGEPLNVDVNALLQLAFLLVVTAILLGWMYNYLLLASFNPSLALSRRVPIRLCNYLFVMLLALIVNLCLRCVGVLLINALLIVPAATAVNLSRNMRQMFWLTIALSLTVSVAGLWASWEVEIASHYQIKLGVPGTIILLFVILFILSMVLGPWYRSRPREDNRAAFGLAKGPSPADNKLPALEGGAE
jgi:zinc transport system permease protein